MDTLYEKVREHADKHTSKRQETEAIIGIHPFFFQVDPSYSETTYRRTRREQMSLWQNIRRNGTSEQQAIAQATIAHLRNNNIDTEYLAAVDTLLQSSLMKILVEDVYNYTGKILDLVEQGAFDHVFFTQRISGAPSGYIHDEDSVYFDEVTSKLSKAYVFGSYSHKCPVTTARLTQARGVEIAPVRDALYNRYSVPETAFGAEWRMHGIEHALENAVSSETLLTTKSV